MTLIIPKRFQQLVSRKKIRYKSTNLKTVYLFHLIHHFIYHYAFDKDEVRLSSSVLQENYGMNYLRYIEYLIENGFIIKAGNYSTQHRKSNKYRLIEKLDDVVIYRSNDFVFDKKCRKRLAEKNQKIGAVKSTIPVSIRKKLISDLNSITIDDTESINFIDTTIIDNRRKYLKNLIMITKIKDGDIFWKFDKHGRFHSNFTNLRKGIRNQYLRIDGEPIAEIDIKTSQPFFLCQILKKEWLINDCDDIKKFIKIVEGGDLYKHFLERYPYEFNDRNSVKPMMFKCLFNKRKKVSHYKAIFRKEFPTVYEFIKNYEVNYGEYLWKSLQRMESHFIFNTVYPAIINQIKNIKLFSVHDSLHFPQKYYSEIKIIWDQKMEILIKK